MQNMNVRERIEAAEKLLNDGSTSIEKLQSIRDLLLGINPQLDKKLIIFSKHLNSFQKLAQGETISLSAEFFPEKTESEKKKKKALLLLIRLQKNLQSEVRRVKAELNFDNDEPPKTTTEQALSVGKIIRYAKGPLGIVTLAAMIIVVAVALTASKKPSVSPVSNVPVLTTKTKAIVFNGKTIPVSEFRIGFGTDCQINGKEAGHYHASEGNSVRAIDGSEIFDPGSCGYGKVEETAIIEVE